MHFYVELHVLSTYLSDVRDYEFLLKFVRKSYVIHVLDNMHEIMLFWNAILIWNESIELSNKYISINPIKIM